jgi:anthranilate/para-aminobenzoate synthase component I
MEIIDELEPHRRNAWCGSIGYVSLCGTLDTSITIRTLTACAEIFTVLPGAALWRIARSRRNIRKPLIKLTVS